MWYLRIRTNLTAGLITILFYLNLYILDWISACNPVRIQANALQLVVPQSLGWKQPTVWCPLHWGNLMFGALLWHMCSYMQYGGCLFSQFVLMISVIFSWVAVVVSLSEIWCWWNQLLIFDILHAMQIK